ncbi:apoptosis inhibitor 5-like protein API5 isoform X1 [Lycium barbarum]|uniref:apoptosis inhibitor 5-like protein API5 isoform X1 n=1 Tax=Lycium barbarum TaxID=112863 RepID=UPI00293E20D0|nr:apoptosis inhibitor 5-like protein API5 isoform X1 [Lycium barbarum]
MADTTDDIEKLYEYGERLNEATDKSQHRQDYEGIIAAANGSVKAKQLAAQLIPKFFKFFPQLEAQALDEHFNLIEDDQLGVRVQAIRGLPLFCKDTPEHLSKIVDILGQLLVAGENVERDAVHKALMTVLRQDVKTSLTALFKRIGSIEDRTAEDLSTWESIREKVLLFLRDKVFPLKMELLVPQELMERHITTLVKQNLQDVTADEFKMFMDFLKSLSLFGHKAPAERIQELVEIIEGQADLDAQFDVSDADHIKRFILCLSMAFPFFKRGASGSKFLNYLNKQIMPVFDKLPEQWKLDLLKNLAECSLYAITQDSRQLLPSVVQLLKKYMVRRKIEEINYTCIECLLYTFHHLAHKTPNATNSLCGYKIVTGQPSDRLGEDFSEQYKDFTERLSTVQDLARAMIKKLTQGMADQNKALAAAKTDEEKDKIKTQKQNATFALRACNNILSMTQPLHTKTPKFIGDQKVNLSWKEVVKPSGPSTAAVAGQKRPAATTNGSSSNTIKKGRGGGGTQHQLVNKAFAGIYDGGRSSGRGGRSWRGRGRGQGRSYR